MYDYRVNPTPSFTDDELGKTFSSYIQVNIILWQICTNVPEFQRNLLPPSSAFIMEAAVYAETSVYTGI
jgi:hypothetical protein